MSRYPIRSVRALLVAPALLVTIPFAVADQPQPPPAQFMIKTQYANLVMDVRGARTADGTAVQTFSRNGPNNDQNQRWLLLRQSDGSYLIKSALCEKYLDVVGDPEADHARLVINAYTGRASQRWFLLPVGEYFVIRNASRERGGIGLNIDVPSGDCDPGRQLQLYHPNGGSNQLWILQRVR
jgi:hypothetical protein